MNVDTIYLAVRSEILMNNVLMHGSTLLMLIVLLAGIRICECRSTVLSVMLPVLSVAWAGSVVRFSFFIHRQGAYLRHLEVQAPQSPSGIPLWETYKASLRSTIFVVPVTDIIILSIFFAATIYLLFGPSRVYWREHSWPGERAYAWSVLAIMTILLASLAVMPRIAEL